MSNLQARTVVILLALVTGPGVPVCVRAAGNTYPESASLAKTIPIADLHFHARTKLTPAQALARMDRNGVRWGGAGGTTKAASALVKGESVEQPGGTGRDLWGGYAGVLGDRFIAFAGQDELIRVFASGGVKALEDAKTPAIQSLLREAEVDLEAGRVKGIGELFVNNMKSSKFKKFKRKSRADSPAIRVLFSLTAKYGAILTIHMDPETSSVTQLKSLLKSAPQGRVLWNHCGHTTTAAQIRPLLARHPNLYCELSYRYPPLQKRAARTIFDKSGPESNWLKLIEDFPDRFMIGTDARNDKDYDGAIAMVRRGLLPYLKPDTLKQVAHGNAKRIFALE